VKIILKKLIFCHKFHVQKKNPKNQNFIKKPPQLPTIEKSLDFPLYIILISPNLVKPTYRQLLEQKNKIGKKKKKTLNRPRFFFWGGWVLDFWDGFFVPNVCPPSHCVPQNFPQW